MLISAGEKTSIFIQIAVRDTHSKQEILMNDKEKTGGGLRLSRRQVIGSAGTAAGAAAVLSAAPWTSLQAEVEKLKKEGWEAHPVACNMCGGYCGLLAMHKKGEPVSQQTVRIMPNPSHPQRGYCGRGASAMWVWNHPLRLRKPLKRVGAKGEGKFKEISWDEALDEIAAKIKAIVDKDGERAVVMTSHNFTGLQRWFAAGLGTPNVITHSSTCNSASVAGRRLVFGKGFDGAGKIEPDYERVRYLLLVGRTLSCAMGIQHVFAKARENGCRVVFVDPRMPEGAFGESTWIPIRPGTDAAFLLALMNVAIRDGLVDEAFLAHQTNAAYLVTDDQKPVTEARLREGGSPERFALIDRRGSKLVFQGVTRNEKGAAVGFDEDPATDPDIRFTGTMMFADGTQKAVKTAFALFAETAAKYTPENAARITGIPAERIVRTARDFFTLGGVCDDGWYSARCGNDAESFALMSIINLMTGRFDRRGGLVVTQGAGYKAPGASFSGGKGSGPQGQKWTVEGGEKKALDKVYYPEGSGTFSATFDAIASGKPYPIRACFVTGTTMFHREANSARLAKALKELELLVVQDILPHEVIDYADYVLPCTYFMEWHEYTGVKWALDGYMQLSDAAIDPPKDADVREEVWQFCEILRRAWPERARERLGYDRELKTREEFRAWYRGMVDKAFAKFVAKKNDEKPGEGDRIAASVRENGWALVKTKKFEVYPYKKPLATPTGKAEIVSFYAAAKYLDKGLKAMSDYSPVKAFTLPKPLSDEFYLVSGKDAASNSGAAMFNKPQQYIGDRTVWMNPADADRLGISSGDMIELTGIDNGAKGLTKVTVTNRVMAGCLFSHGFSGGVRTKHLAAPGYEWVREGINSHWFCTGYRQAVVGGLANNASVRVKRV
jgi:thiosulfate reductase / polysulfide reductase chain A